MNRIAVYTILSLLSFQSIGQEKVSYHQCEVTDPGNFKVLKWNISQDSLSVAYIKEISDSKGRVIELKFLINNSLDYSVECGISKWMKFKYPNDSTIVEYHFDNSGKPIVGYVCDIPYQRTYHLSKDQKLILRTEDKYHVDTALYLKINKTLKNLDSDIQKMAEWIVPKIVEPYIKSFYKLNGRFPIKKDFDVYQYWMTEEEKKSIMKSLILK